MHPQTIEKIKVRNMISNIAINAVNDYLGIHTTTVRDSDITYKGTQNDENHNYTCVYDITTNDSVIRVYLSPSDGSAIGEVKLAEDIISDTKAYTYSINIHVDKSMLDNKLLAKIAVAGEYGYTCPDLDLYIEELPVILQEGFDMPNNRPMLSEDGNLILIEGENNANGII